MDSRKAEDEVQDLSATEASSSRKISFDLNGSPSPDTPVQSDGPEDDTGSRNSGSDDVIDWSRGSVEIAPDGRLAFHGSEPPPPEAGQEHGFDLNAAVREAEAEEEARRFPEFQQDEEHKFDLNDSAPHSDEEPDEVSLWFH